MKFVSGAVLGMALAGFAAAPSDATTVTLEVLQSPSSLSGSPSASAQIDGRQVEDFGSNQFFVGPFVMGVVGSNPVESFIAWCLQVDVLIETDATVYDTHPTPISAERVTLLNQLFNGYLGETTAAEKAAAFQLAIWEIVEEDSTDIGDLDLTKGRFTAASSGSAGIIGIANGYLAGLGGTFDVSNRLNFFQSGSSQDLVSASPIPLPASVLFLGAGLGALALMRRRRGAKASAA